MGLLYFVAQMLRTVLGAVILTLLYYQKKGFTHDLSSNGDGVGWSWVNALVGEFMLTFLLVFTVLQTAFYSDLDFSSLVCITNWFGRVPEPLHLIAIDGAPSIRPVLSFQLSGLGSPGAKGHLPAHVGLLVWAIGRCCSCKFCP